MRHICAHTHLHEISKKDRKREFFKEIAYTFVRLNKQIRVDQLFQFKMLNVRKPHDSMVGFLFTTYREITVGRPKTAPITSFYRFIESL